MTALTRLLKSREQMGHGVRATILEADATLEFGRETVDFFVRQHHCAQNFAEVLDIHCNDECALWGDLEEFAEQCARDNEWNGVGS